MTWAGVLNRARVSQVVASLRVFVLVTGVWVVDLGH